MYKSKDISGLIDHHKMLLQAIPAQEELLLSAQLQAEEPSSAAKVLIRPTIDPYVPATIKNVPSKMTNTHQATIAFQRMVPLAYERQLSYSHMIPSGWKQRRVPKRAPTRDTRPPKAGMPLAMQYAMTVVINVQPSQVDQWMTVFAVRCLDPRKIRMKMYFAVICYCQ